MSADSSSFSRQTVGRERDLMIADGDISDEELGPGVRPGLFDREVGRLPLEAWGGFSRSLYRSDCRNRGKASDSRSP